MVLNKKIWQFLVIALSSMLILGGCASGKSEQAGSANNTFKIVTSFYPMYIATVNITKGVDGVEVVNMTKPQTGCLHDYQLTPEDMKKLEKANAFVVNGAGMEAFLDKAVKQQKDMKIIDASQGIELIKDAEGENPHVWVSVSDAILQVKNIAEQLEKADPAHASAYEANAKAYIEKLEALKTEMHVEIDSLPNRNIVTFHEAFPYFAKEFNLHIAAVIEREPGSQPTPQELEATVAQIKELKIKALFAEPQYPADAAQTISRESGAKVYALDPVVTGDADENAADAYINAMKKNAKVLREALQ
jgi:zinc transport system substrate-binding protein